MKICIFFSKICDFPEQSDGTVSIVMLEHIFLTFNHNYHNYILYGQVVTDQTLRLGVEGHVAELQLLLRPIADIKARLRDLPKLSLFHQSPKCFLILYKSLPLQQQAL